MLCCVQKGLSLLSCSESVPGFGREGRKISLRMVFQVQRSVLVSSKRHEAHGSIFKTAFNGQERERNVGLHEHIDKR